MKTFKAFLLLALLTGFMAACEYVTIEPIRVVINPTDTIKFSEDIAPMLDPLCTGCHGGGIAPDLRSANSYNALKNKGCLDTPSVNSKLWLKVNADPAHGTSAQLTNEQKAKIKKWLDEGALNN